MTAYADPYEFDARPVVSVVLASGSVHGRLVAADEHVITIERPNGSSRPVPTSAVEGVFPLRFPDPKIWGRNRPPGPAGRPCIQGQR